MTPTKTPTPTPTLTPKICIAEGFDDFDSGTRPAGWTFTNCNQNTDTYTTAGDFGAASPSLKLDATGDIVTTVTFSSCDDLSFWLKGQGTDATSALLVEEYYASWSTVTNITNLPTSGTTMGAFTINTGSTQLRFSYTKSAGDLGFDDVDLTETGGGGGGRSFLPEEEEEIPQYLAIDSSDFDGDGIADVAVFRPSTGLWLIRGLGRAYFGRDGDVPVAGDYDGDGTADIAVFRSGLWAIEGMGREYFGREGDVPLPSDYDGDFVIDLGIYRDGLWAIQGITRAYLGAAGDVPVPGDYDGDGLKDLAVFRPQAGLWAIEGMDRIYYGGPGDVPVPGDYYGDGTDEVGIFRPSAGMWSVRGLEPQYLGQAEDIAVPADYTGDAVPEIAIFRPAPFAGGSGLWVIRNFTRIYFGADADVPVAK